MSKIDEIIASAQEYFDADFSHDELVVSVRDLYQLRPYVELAELHMKLAELYLIGTKLNWFEWTDEMNELYSRQKELIQQIKEQQCQQ